MEQLLHYVWKHKLFPLNTLRTTNGMTVEVIDPGLHNRNAGPDFFNAKIKLDGTLWVGNIEIHSKASDWYRHGHETDPNYDNVILHVVGESDAEVKTQAETTLPQLQLEIPPMVLENYQNLLETDKYPPCYKIIPQLSTLTQHAWMNALQTERLEQKTEAIGRRVELCDGSWEAAYFVTLARNYGFGINGNAFEQWAMSIPLYSADHHRDDLHQIEAFFMGQAGLLDPMTVPEKYREQAKSEGYFDLLRNEYLFLARKFAISPIDFKLWKFLRLRPQNFPHIRISQLANLYFHRRTGLMQLIECKNADDIRNLFRIGVTEYWETHYSFGAQSEKSEKRLSSLSLDLIIINTAVPMIFAYGKHKNNEELCQRAYDLLEQIKAENNHIVRLWKECGMTVENAGDSQALIQLKNEYCDRKECLRCRIGYHYLSAISHDKP